MNAEFWSGKRVFLTGHTGFKGGWLALWLGHLGADVTGYALPAPTDPSLFEVARVADGMRSVINDVRDAASLNVALRDAEPDVVFHLAAQPLVRASYLDPVETYSTNVMGLVNLLEAVRQQPSVRAFVNVTSDKCYENREWVWGYREVDPLGGHDPYSNSKGCAELVSAAYRSSYFSDNAMQRHPAAIATARAGNVIGGGDWAQDRLVPDVLRALDTDMPIVLRRPAAIRPWQHVLEPLAGYLTLAERLCVDGRQFAEAWNFGPDPMEARPVRWLVERIAEISAGRIDCLVDAESHPHEAGFLRLDCSKAMSRLDWRPQWGLEAALERTVEWHAQYRRGADMRRVSMRQIAEYQLGYGVSDAHG